MTRSAKITLDWGDGEHVFRLALGQLEELDELCDIGPGFALGMLLTGVHGNWKAKWIREVMRLGLIGGGMDPGRALKLVRTYIDTRPIGESLPHARAVLEACIIGVADDPPGEPVGAGENPSPPSQMDASGSATSKAPRPPRASRRRSSATRASGS